MRRGTLPMPHTCKEAVTHSSSGRQQAGGTSPAGVGCYCPLPSPKYPLPHGELYGFSCVSKDRSSLSCEAGQKCGIQEFLRGCNNKGFSTTPARGLTPTPNDLASPDRCCTCWQAVDCSPPRATGSLLHGHPSATHQLPISYPCRLFPSASQPDATPPPGLTEWLGLLVQPAVILGGSAVPEPAKQAD